MCVQLSGAKYDGHASFASGNVATKWIHLGVQALVFSGGDFTEIFIDSHIGIRYLTQCITGNELRVK